MKETARCNKCGATYDDKESVELVKKWKSEDGYAPCPNFNCQGQMGLIGQDNGAGPTNV